MINAGKCYYCNQDVFVGEGQLMKMIRIEDKEDNVVEYPSHKKCRDNKFKQYEARA